MPGPMLNRFKCWQHLLFPSLLTCLLFSRVTEDKNMCSRIWRSLRLGRCDRRSHSCRLKNSRTWRLIKILFLHICCRRYKVLFVFIPFCLFVCVFHNDHNSNSRCPFLHCWHAINTSSSAHLSSYLFLFSTRAGFSADGAGGSGLPALWSVARDGGRQCGGAEWGGEVTSLAMCPEWIQGTF